MEYWEKRGIVELFFNDGQIEERGVEELMAEIEKDLMSELKNISDERRDEYIIDWADGHVLIYDYDILNWYIKDLQRLSFADDALVELDGHEENIVSLLQYGIYLLLFRYAEWVLEKLRGDEKR